MRNKKNRLKFKINLMTCFYSNLCLCLTFVCMNVCLICIIGSYCLLYFCWYFLNFYYSNKMFFKSYFKELLYVLCEIYIKIWRFIFYRLNFIHFVITFSITHFMIQKQKLMYFRIRLMFIKFLMKH